MLTLHWRHNGRDGVSNHQPHDCLLNRLFRHRSKKISKLRVTGLCAGNSPGTGEFPAQMASNAENVSIWRHHEERPTPGHLRQWISCLLASWQHEVPGHQQLRILPPEYFSLCFIFIFTFQIAMMTSWNGNIFRVTGLCAGNSPGTGEFPTQRASNAELWCFLWSSPE